MSTQPRDENGHFVSTEKVNSDGNVVFYISEFESRAIGNRLGRAAKRYSELFDNLDAPVQLQQDCNYWSKRFLQACTTRSNCDDEYYENGKKRHTDANNYVCVTLTDYECWSLGNRLFEIGDWFEKKGYDKIAQETKWLARRFHAERNEQI